MFLSMLPREAELAYVTRMFASIIITISVLVELKYRVRV